MSKKEGNLEATGFAEPKDTRTQEDITKDVVDSSSGPRDRHGQFAWQPYPLSPFVERLDWILDIFCNFRGMGWNWRTSALPPPPKAIQIQLLGNSGSHTPNHSFKTHSGQAHQYTSREILLRRNLFTLIKGYFIMDLFKTTMMHDPYFWGYTARPPPAYFPSILTLSPVTTHAYRLLLSMLMVKYALQTIFSLGPLFFSGLLSTSLLGARAEPWMYPETWASYDVVLEKGLAGWWGNWWHQTFRFAFQEPSQQKQCGF
ncbi:membrane bound O-acyl transferase family-like protein [Stemphylium lycopersici]|nr:membrane bound O-acyl transferase family-like protein [Stemphylium lycopersici]